MKEYFFPLKALALYRTLAFYRSFPLSSMFLAVPSSYYFAALAFTTVCFCVVGFSVPSTTPHLDGQISVFISPPDRVA
jgi:hypothetical protein